MKIPSKLKVGAHTFKIKQVDIENCGEIDRSKMVIYLSTKLAPSQRGSTLFHELLHIINSELDHVLLDSLAEQLYATLKNNEMLK